MFEREKKKHLSLHEKVNENIYVSKMEEISLVNFVKVSSFVCKELHKQLCTNCEGKIKVAKYVLQQGYTKRLYGFQDMNRRMVKVEDAAKKVYNIRVAIEKIAHIKEKALGNSLIKRKRNFRK